VICGEERTMNKSKRFRIMASSFLKWFIGTTIGKTRF